MSNILSELQIENVITEIIKKIAGKRIKKISYSCGITNKEDESNIYEKHDVILLKKNKNIIFVTYNIKDRYIIFSTSSSEISNIEFKKISQSNYSIMLYDGLYWDVKIEL